jgi:serine/threonine protein kinase
MRIGEIIDGRYRIERLLGEGGMGSVYLAHDISLGKKVAIKTLLPKMLADLRSIQQLRKEVRISQELRHENICATYDLHESLSQPYMVMEYVDGDTLTNFIFRQPGHRCNEATFRCLAEQILAAIECAHRAGVVHRDLKSGNIMVTSSGSVRVMDFGIAASLKEVSSRTTGAPISLSIHYASPEQINGDPPAATMDIYSLGCVFYEMLSGEPPFRLGDVMHQQLTRKPNPIPGIAPALNSFLMACLVKDWRHRIQSIPEMRASLAGDRTVKITKTTPGRLATASTAQVAAGIPDLGHAASHNWLPAIWGTAALLVIAAVFLLWQQNASEPRAKSETTFGSTATAPAAPDARLPSSAVGRDTDSSPARKEPLQSTASEQATADPAAQERPIAELLGRARSEFNNAQYETAIANCEAVLRLNSRNLEAQQLKARIVSAQAVEARIFGGGESTEEWITKGDRFFAEYRYQEAIDAFKKALELAPSNQRAKTSLDRAAKAKAAEEALIKK